MIDNLKPYIDRVIEFFSNGLPRDLLILFSPLIVVFSVLRYDYKAGSKEGDWIGKILVYGPITLFFVFLMAFTIKYFPTLAAPFAIILSFLIITMLFAKIGDVIEAHSITNKDENKEKNQTWLWITIIVLFILFSVGLCALLLSGLKYLHSFLNSF